MGDRPATEREVYEKEIDVTSEMIEAGIKVLNSGVVVDLAESWVAPSVVVERIFRAMLRSCKLRP